MSTDITTPEIEEKKSLDLNVDVKEVSACERHVTVTIPRTEIDRYFQKQYDDLAPQAEVPGFRAGKAPR
ncbi:MAG: trigger factor family protein, partial [Planctomycetota bacterium]